MKIFAERLKELRKESHLTLEELSKQTGISKMAICRWEREERVPSFENAVVIAKYFKVSTDYLCGLED